MKESKEEALRRLHEELTKNIRIRKKEIPEEDIEIDKPLFELVPVFTLKYPDLEKMLNKYGWKFIK